MTSQGSGICALWLIGVPADGGGGPVVGGLVVGGLVVGGDAVDGVAVTVGGVVVTVGGGPVVAGSAAVAVPAALARPPTDAVGFRPTVLVVVPAGPTVEDGPELAGGPGALVAGGPGALVAGGGGMPGIWAAASSRAEPIARTVMVATVTSITRLASVPAARARR